MFDNAEDGEKEEKVCNKVERVDCGDSTVYTAKCTDGMAIVDLYVGDRRQRMVQKDESIDVEVPPECGGRRNGGSYAVHNKRCHFQYQLDCTLPVVNKMLHPRSVTIEDLEKIEDDDDDENENDDESDEQDVDDDLTYNCDDDVFCDDS